MIPSLRYLASPCGLALLLALAPSSAQVAADCAGATPWSTTTTYAAGDQVTYRSGLYKAIVSTTNVQPDYCPSCGWWQYVDACGPVDPCTAVPAAPGKPSVAYPVGGPAAVSWAPVAAPAGCSLTYVVYNRDAVLASGLSTPSITLSTPGTYVLTVAAVDAAGTSPRSPSVELIIPDAPCTARPLTPTGLMASSATSTTITLNWSPVASTPTCPVRYNVFKDGSLLVSGLSEAGTTVSGLGAGKTYQFAVNAVNPVGESPRSPAIPAATVPDDNACAGVADWNPSAVYTKGMRAVAANQLWEAQWWVQGVAPSPSPWGPWKYLADCGSLTCTAAPSVPMNLATTGGTSTNVTLVWAASTAPAGCTVSYRIYQNGVQIGKSTTPSFKVSGLAANSSYSFSVAAEDAAGLSPMSQPISYRGLVCGAAPSVPGGLAVSRLTCNSLTLTWNAASAAGCVITYKVYKNGALIATVPTTSFNVTGLSELTTYAFSVVSSDEVGSSAPSASVSVTTPGCGTPTLPKHILTGYWQNFNNGAKVLRIREVPTTYDLICVSFADATGTPGAVTFALDGSLGFTEAEFIADIAAVKARGQHVIISVGGQNGTISVSDASSAANFASSINLLMAKYGFEGVDIDLENGVNPTYMAQALRQIKAGAIIAMAPETIYMQSASSAYLALCLAVKDILTVVNTQYYNSGAMLGQDGKVYNQGGVDFLTALASTALEAGLRDDQVGLGLPASPSGAGSGYVSPAIVNDALGCLAGGSGCGAYTPVKAYPAIRGAMTWSINWDASNGFAFANAVSPYLRSLP